MKAGDILLVHSGKSLVAKGITEFMRQYCEINGYQYSRLYHHAAIVIEYQHELMIAEAVGRGWVVHSIKDAYTETDYQTRVDIFRPEAIWTKNELKRIADIALDYSLKITRYDYANFLFQMIMIRTGIWLGKKGAKAEGRLYCSEGVATIINKVRPYMCEEPWRYNPMDLYLEPGIKMVARGF
jgi:hypothetical protein